MLHHPVLIGLEVGLEVFRSLVNVLLDLRRLRRQSSTLLILGSEGSLDFGDGVGGSGDATIEIISFLPEKEGGMSHFQFMFSDAFSQSLQ